MFLREIYIVNQVFGKHTVTYTSSKVKKKKKEQKIQLIVIHVKGKRKITYRSSQNFLQDYHSCNILENHCLTCNVHKRKKRLKSKR